MPIEKAELRKIYREKRQSYPAKHRSNDEKQILHFFKFIPRGVDWLLYLPVNDEISPLGLLPWIQSRAEKVFFPVASAKLLEFFEATHFPPQQEGWSLKNPGPAWTPKRPSVVVMPGLIFGSNGHRIGYGGGHYDRFLAAFPRACRIGLGFDFQVRLENWPFSEQDARLDSIVTPSARWGSPRPNE